MSTDFKRNWSRDETILAFGLYCTIPSSKVTVWNQEVIDLARAINRTPASVKLKLQNFKSNDPLYTVYGRVGLRHGSKLDEEVSAEFMQNWDLLAEEIDRLKHQLQIPITSKEQILDKEFIGYDKYNNKKIRIGQTFFRKVLLSIYNDRCCITGFSIPELLRASHIKPWAFCNDVNEKANPTNGLLLNALFDAAFDEGYISVSSMYKVMVSKKISNYTDKYTRGIFSNYNEILINLPNRFLPDKKFLEYHNDVIFRG